MRILLISTSFNSFTQRVFTELKTEHYVSIEFAHTPKLMRDAVELFEPDVIICPFLKQAVPDDIWKNYLTIIMHPGIVGDRGSSSIDWAILEGERQWGMTALEADAEMDAGDVWSTHNFELPLAPKSSVYRNLAADAGMKGIFDVLKKLKAFRRLAVKAGVTEVAGSARTDIDRVRSCFPRECEGLAPRPWNQIYSMNYGRLRPSMKQIDRRIDWATDTTEAIVRKIHSADGFPGVLERICDVEYFMFGAHFEDELGKNTIASPGEIIAVRHGAICRKTIYGAVWISHLKQKKGEKEYFKLPAVMALPAGRLEGVPESPISTPFQGAQRTFKEIWYEERNEVGYLFWEFHNGAMSTEQCERLKVAIRAARQRSTKVLAFMGGKNFWSNGIHLNIIEAAPDPALESWQNINAMDDVVLEILTIDDRLTISAIGANAGAGGVMLALASDQVAVREGVVLNPHYKAMGLYGSEYWTYSLPKRVGHEKATELTNECLPINARTALEIGLVDSIVECDTESFRSRVVSVAEALASISNYDSLLTQKHARRAREEAEKPLSLYRREELNEMRINFWDENSDFHLARRNFVYKIDGGQAPLRLARHRWSNGAISSGTGVSICGAQATDPMLPVTTTIDL
jgi:putative two-component system hydrogenase maturation factor HypX/HoxX